MAMSLEKLKEYYKEVKGVETAPSGKQELVKGIRQWILGEYEYEQDFESAVHQLREIGYSLAAAHRIVSKAGGD